MFEFIGNILQNIANFFVSIWEFITHVFEEIVYIIKLLGAAVASIPSYFTWLPGSVIALILVTIAIVVIYKVAGREG